MKREGVGLMKALSRLLFFIVAFLLFIYLSDFSVEDDKIFNQSSSSSKEDLIGEAYAMENRKEISMNEGLGTFMGKKAEEIKDILGEPQRIDPTPYGYDWWIYNQDLNRYLQIGVKNGEVVTIFTNSSEMNITPFYIGQSITEIFNQFPIHPVISIDYIGGNYRFELSENDININPLIPMEDFFVQLYMDKFEGKLSSIRLMNVETLLTIRPYELTYIGKLLEVRPLNEEEEWDVSMAITNQIFDLTNVLRLRHNRQLLKMDDLLSEVALAHSMDMFEGNYFSHVSETYGELRDRLDASDIEYEIAGENIAANYIDAAAVVEGWFNSVGHRETLLHNDFSYIGIGVYKNYFTQNFID